MTRLLTIMGSGETAPTMVKMHRAVVDRLGPPPVHGVLLDTPFGFQMNADELVARAVTYFHDSVGFEMEAAGMRSAADLGGPGGDAVLARLAAAPLIFAGPGSPTYALRNWASTLVPSMLAEKLTHGGALTFASAAALTLGVVTVPVYEIYKVGDDPHWEEGLDLLTDLGLHVAVIPHYDNAEGGTHDTRFCYLGEQRLRMLEPMLPDGAFVLGVDEHTALFLDFETDTAWVSGRGVVTVRAQGRSTTLESGAEFPISRLPAMAEELRSGWSPEPATVSSATTAAADADADAEAPSTTAPRPPAADGGGSPLLEAIRSFEAQFRTAKAERDVPTMRDAALSLEAEMWAWRADTLQSDEFDRGRAALRAMVTDLAELAEEGARDPAETIGPFVALALGLREKARQEGRFEDADWVREQLAEHGIEVRDTPQGPTWVFEDR